MEGMATPAPERRWFRFSLRTTFVVVTLAAILLGVLPHVQVAIESARQKARRVHCRNSIRSIGLSQSKEGSNTTPGRQSPLFSQRAGE
jgi:hypothetical protein